jgi:hypothetical protein
MGQKNLKFCTLTLKSVGFLLTMSIVSRYYPCF